MQLLPTSVQPVTSNGCVSARSAILVEFISKSAEVDVRFPDVLQVAGHEFENDHIVQVSDDRNVIRQNIFRVAEVHERRKDALAVAIGQAPVVVIKHLDQRLELRQPRCNEVRQRFTSAYIGDDAPDGVDDLGFFRILHDVPGFAQRVPEKLQVAVGEFERESDTHLGS